MSGVNEYRNSLLFFIFLCSLLCSCSKVPVDIVIAESGENKVNGILTEDEALAIDYHINGTKRVYEQIINEAASVVSFLEATAPISKSSGNRRVCSFVPIFDVKNSSKSFQRDTLAYIVSFGDSLGYAVITSDRRAEPVIVICPEGNFSDKQEAFLPDAEDFYEGIRLFIQHQVEEALAKQDSLLDVAITKLGEQFEDTTGACSKVILDKNGTYLRTEYYYGDWQTKIQSGPFLKVKWGQNSPYNMYSDEDSGILCPTGCVATALAQIMSYWEYPNDYNWTALTSQERIMDYSSIKLRKEVARLMRNIGDGVNMKYSASGSSSTDSKARNFLSSIGYNVGCVKKYNSGDVIESIKSGYPVYAAGYKDCLLKNECLYWIFPNGGHAWVIDGYLSQKRTVVFRVFGGKKATKVNPQKKTSEVHEAYYTESRTLMHCNFGWDGWRDGWYADGIFDTVKGASIPDKNSGNPNSGSSNYKYGLSCICKIYR